MNSSGTFQDPKPLPLELLCTGLDAQARRRPTGTGSGGWNPRYGVSKECCFDHFPQTHRDCGPAKKLFLSRGQGHWEPRRSLMMVNSRQIKSIDYQICKTYYRYLNLGPLCHGENKEVDHHGTAWIKGRPWNLGLRNIGFLALLFTSCMALDKLLKLLKPHFAPHQNGNVLCALEGYSKK